MFHKQVIALILISSNILSVSCLPMVPVHLNITGDQENAPPFKVSSSSQVEFTSSLDWKEYPLLISDDIPPDSINASNNLPPEEPQSKVTRKSLFLDRFLKHRNVYYYDNELEDKQTNATDSTTESTTVSSTVTASIEVISNAQWFFENYTNVQDLKGLADEQDNEGKAANGKNVEYRRMLKWKKANALNRVKIAREEAAKQKFLESLDIRRSGGGDAEDEIPNPTTTTTEPPGEADPLAPVCPRIKYIYLPFYVWALLASFLFYKMRKTCMT